MLLHGILLTFALLLILVAAEIFTNALEELGERLSISEGIIGSLFAAVGTALPETMVPVLALMGGTQSPEINEEIGVGAILGAPLMLGTLAIFFMAIAAIKLRGIRGRITPETTGFTRDMNFFLVAFSLSSAALFLPHDPPYYRFLLSIMLITIYIIYVVSTFQASKQLVKKGYGTEANHTLLFNKIGLKDTTCVAFLQLLVGLILLAIGAKGFIIGVKEVSQALAFSPLILSLLIIPIATELPEKVNSITWIRRSKDTLAFGNITGAMVLQGTLLPALGILLTSWQPSKDILPGIIITMLAALWLRLNASRNGLSILSLTGCGVLYVIYLWVVLGR